jgi:hypothetical protein
MEWAALIAWVITAGGGFTLLALWLRNGGMAQQDQPGRRIRPPQIFSHFALAAGGLVVWIIYLITDSDVLSWVAFVVLVPVALLGFTMFALWLQRRQSATAATATPAAAGPRNGSAQPAEQRFPVPIVALHGLLAVTTVVLVLLTALGVGD